MAEQLKTKRTFSQDDRARLRASLLDYMKEHKIGVPTLQLRIAQAAGREPHLLPLKTLQRFLADTTRTNDSLLSLCFQFAESVKPKAEGEALAEAAAAFFDAPASGGEGLNGRWIGAAAGNKRGIVVVAAGVDRTSVTTSELVIDTPENAKGLRIRETVTNPAANRTAKYDPGFRHRYEGMALSFSPLLCVILKNTLTRLPRTYWLNSDPDTMHGHGVEAIFGASPQQLVSDLAAFRFERILDEG